MKELINEAYEMLMDRQKAERDLIIYVAKMDDESRSAIILAAGLIKDCEEESK